MRERLPAHYYQHRITLLPLHHWTRVLSHSFRIFHVYGFEGKILSLSVQINADTESCVTP
jgi:hypothetical protein